jgi:hypothetical protein
MANHESLSPEEDTKDSTQQVQETPDTEFSAAAGDLSDAEVLAIIKAAIPEELIG